MRMSMSDVLEALPIVGAAIEAGLACTEADTDKIFTASRHYAHKYDDESEWQLARSVFLKTALHVCFSRSESQQSHPSLRSVA